MHRSGIRVDEELKKEFLTAQNNSNILFIQVKIIDDTFKKTASGNITGNETKDFQAIASILKPADPCYILTRAAVTQQGQWLPILYVPENSMVKLKMLYASSAIGLKDGLGGAKFLPDYFMTLPSECTLASYKHSIKQFSKEEILTMDEITKLEEHTAAALAMSQTKSVAIADLPLSAADECTTAISNLKSGSIGSVIFLLNKQSEILQVDSHSSNWTLDDIAKKMPSDEPRYIVHKFTHDVESKQLSPFIFFYYCPEKAVPRQKMTYSSCKSIAVKIVEKFGLTISKHYEFNDVKELNQQAILAELYPKQSEKKVFGKPKKPGKGKAKLTGNTKFDQEK